MRNPKLIAIAMSMSIIFWGMPVVSVGAKSNTEKLYTTTDGIPASLNAYAKIYFTDATHYYYLDEGEPVDEEYLNQEDYTDELYATADKSNAKVQELPTPVSGTIVSYASDGAIYEIKGNNADAYTEVDMETEKDEYGISPFAVGGTLIAQWGDHNNRLYLTSYNEIQGIGRATTYNDKVGQQDHVLKKGDVAIKKEYDRCSCGSDVNVVHKVKGTDTRKTVTMKKWDVGGMPDAVIDIWKTGVKYWGYEYSSSFSLPGQTEIFHAYK